MGPINADFVSQGVKVPESLLNAMIFCFSSCLDRQVLYCYLLIIEKASMACHFVQSDRRLSRHVCNSLAVHGVFESLAVSLDRPGGIVTELGGFASCAGAAAKLCGRVIKLGIAACSGQNFDFCEVQAND